MLRIQNLSATVDDTLLLHNISYTFETGRTYALLGPNGSGKSTLAHAVLGRPDLVLGEDSRLLLADEDITTIPTHERAQRGLFLSLQNPPSLSGITVGELLRLAVGGRLNALEIRQTTDRYAEFLGIGSELLRRSLGEGFSGGEKKKMEVLQWALLAPRFSLFDEIDTGVDVDAMKTIARFLAAHRTPEQTLVFITHSVGLLDALPPDATLVLEAGRLVREGDGALAKSILIEEGFGSKEK